MYQDHLCWSEALMFWRKESLDNDHLQTDRFDAQLLALDKCVTVRIVVFRTFYFRYFSNQLHSFPSISPSSPMPIPIHDPQTWPGLHILYPRNGLRITSGCNS